MSAIDARPTPWASGRLDGRRGHARLLFGRMHEDWRLEASIIPAGCRVFCIASAGCTSLALASRGDDVTAVDINPAQVAYVQSRLGGGPTRDGTADRVLQLGRRLLAMAGVGRTLLGRFLNLSHPADQLTFWDTRLAARISTALRVALNGRILRLGYASEFVRSLPHGFHDLLSSRLRRGVARHLNRDNAYLWELFLGRPPPGLCEYRHDSRRRLRLVCADAAEYLESVRGGSFDAFSLSNILDGASESYRIRLFRAVQHAAAPAAVVILRSLSEPRSAADAAWAARDRAPLWGSISVAHIGTDHHALQT